MPLGVLDIGSNATQLQVIEVRQRQPLAPAHAKRAATRLGEALTGDGRLGPEAINRLSAALDQATLAARERNALRVRHAGAARRRRR